MKVKELVEKLSKLKDDTEVKIGYGQKVMDINFIHSEKYYVLLHPNIYMADAGEEWTTTFLTHGKLNCSLTDLI